VRHPLSGIYRISVLQPEQNDTHKGNDKIHIEKQSGIPRRIVVGYHDLANAGYSSAQEE
jgi:hypothetical protein